MLKDFLGNKIEEGKFVVVELDNPLVTVKGKIDVFEPGRASTLAAPGKQPQITPTRMIVMVPVEVALDPRGEIATKITVLQEPPAEKKTEEPPAE